jgi:hypothetical protein
MTKQDSTTTQDSPDKSYPPDHPLSGLGGHRGSGWPIIDSAQRAHLWIGDMLRRYHAEHPDGLANFRTDRAWEKLIEWQVAPGGWMPTWLHGSVVSFLQAGTPYSGPPWYNFAGHNQLGPDNPWSIQYRSILESVRVVKDAPGPPIRIEYRRGEYSMNRVPTYEQDLIFHRTKHGKELATMERHHMEEHLRMSAIKRQWDDSGQGQRWAEKQRLEQESIRARTAERAANGGKMPPFIYHQDPTRSKTRNL